MGETQMVDGRSKRAAGRKDSARIWSRLWDPCDNASVAVFRMAFGLIVLWHVVRYFTEGLIEFYFEGRPHFLTYFGFEWVKPFDVEGMRWVYYVMAMSAVGVCLGLLYRLCAVLLFATFSFTFLAEASQYQNHYYLILLVAFLLILVPAHRSFSIDAILFPSRASWQVPNWCRWLLMFQIAVPYFYGGLAKVNGDWLHALPVLFWAPTKSHLAFVGPFFAEPSAAWFISYFGLVFDLLIVPFLLWERTRVLAFVLAVGFHLSNAVLFSIDVFPWMMILTTPILFSADWPRKLLRLNVAQSGAKPNAAVPPYTPRQQLTIGVVTVYVIFQILFPLRHMLYPGDPGWTNEGQQFAWRMMLIHKRTFSIVDATDRASGKTVEVPMRQLLTDTQLFQLVTRPHQLVATAPFLAEWVRTEYGFDDVEIRAVVLSSFNGRKPQLQVNPDLNLLTVKRSIWPQPGIIPLTEPRREEPWNVPTSRWPEELGIELPDLHSRP
jgi:vitamin K-dependent gamma-carboxylase